jgi:conjugal transfer pilus assembly protein TraB
MTGTVDGFEVRQSSAASCTGRRSRDPAHRRLPRQRAHRKGHPPGTIAVRKPLTLAEADLASPDTRNLDRPAHSQTREKARSPSSSVRTEGWAMTDAPSTSTPVQADPASPSPVTRLNAKTARRQKLLLGSLGVARACRRQLVHPGRRRRREERRSHRRADDRHGRARQPRPFAARVRRDLRQPSRCRDPRAEGAEGRELPREEIEAQLAALKAENQAMRVDGQAAIDAISAENADLKTRLAASQHPAPASVPPPAYGPQAGGYDARGRTFPSRSAAQAGGGSAVKRHDARARRSEADELHLGQGRGKRTSRFARPGCPAGRGRGLARLPAAQFLCPARVIVGVDASAGVASQTDPLPVVLRITGPARSVMQNGKVLTTRIQGCIVNGAARGDLSSARRSM